MFLYGSYGFLGVSLYLWLISIVRPRPSLGFHFWRLHIRLNLCGHGLRPSARGPTHPSIHPSICHHSISQEIFPELWVPKRFLIWYSGTKKFRELWFEVLQSIIYEFGCIPHFRLSESVVNYMFQIHFDMVLGWGSVSAILMPGAGKRKTPKHSWEG